MSIPSHSDHRPFGPLDDWWHWPAYLLLLGAIWVGSGYLAAKLHQHRQEQQWTRTYHTGSGTRSVREDLVEEAAYNALQGCAHDTTQQCYRQEIDVQVELESSMVGDSHRAELRQDVADYLNMHFGIDLSAPTTPNPASNLPAYPQKQHSNS